MFDLLRNLDAVWQPYAEGSPPGWSYGPEWTPHTACGVGGDLGPTPYSWPDDPQYCDDIVTVWPADVGKVAHSSGPNAEVYTVGFFNSLAMEWKPVPQYWQGPGRAAWFQARLPKGTPMPPLPTWSEGGEPRPVVFAPPPWHGGIIGALDPETLPILAPAHPGQTPSWRDLPLRRPHPDRVPGYQREVGPTRDRARAPDQSPVISDEIAPGPTVIIDPRSRPKPQPAREDPFIPRSVKKEREVKVRVKLGPFSVVMNTVTESLDFIRAIHDALPWQCRKSRYWDEVARRWRWTRISHRPDRMLADIKKCFDHIDWQKAFENVIANEVDDYVIGKLGRAQARANAASGRVVGYGAGGTNQRVSAPGVDYGPSLGEQVAETIGQIIF